MTLAKETQDFLLSKFISNIGTESEETVDDWFEHKLNHALKDIEQISDENKDNIYNVVTTHYETKLTVCNVNCELEFESRTEMKLCCGNARFVRDTKRSSYILTIYP